MEILGVGLPELALIVLVALILLGPKDMVSAGKTLGKALNKFYKSGTWHTMRRTGEEIQQLPTRLMREANLEEFNELRELKDQVGEQIQEVTNTIRPKGYYPRAIDEAAGLRAKPRSAPAVDAPRPTPPENTGS